MRRLEIEPLDRARWERIEGALRDRLEKEPLVVEAPAPRSRSRARVVGLAFAVAALVFAGVIGVEKLHPARVVVAAPSSETRVETEGAPSHVSVGESSLDVGEHTVARIDGNDGVGVTVVLERGVVTCEVAPRHGRPPFVVRAGDVVVRVVGTRFRVERERSGTRVSVERGAVEVEAGGSTTLVSAGSSWPSETHAAVSPEDLPKASASAFPRAVQPAPSTSSAPAVASSRERYERAMTLEGTHPEEAITLYRELAEGSDSWAMNALYAEGRLELERGNKSAARARFAEYVRRYPTGPNAIDARALSTK